ncbi:MAG TPA: condensation domain-containing protein [Pseudonocardiaceae bacterium]|nr:condensation domain-containing protein [Pseudonocardiaceae bacterium]
MYTVRQVLVPFAGEGAGVAELTWGQVGFWQGMADGDRSLTMGGVSPPRPGMTVEQVAADLGYLVGRHQALRTRLRMTDDPFRPKQVCSTDGEVALEVVEVTDEDPAMVADTLRIQYEERKFDYEHEWPVRMAAIVADGAVTHVVAVYLHLAIDASALEVLVADLAARDPDALPGPVTAMQPVEQAAQQQTTAARRANIASLRHLERVLRTVSTTRFGPPKYGTDMAFRVIRYQSPATAAAIHVVATRAETNTSSVLIACFAVGLARFTGVNPVLAMLLVSNRFRPGFAESVSPVVQLSPYMIDVADATLGEAVTRATASVFNTYKTAYYDPFQQDEVVDRVNAERGEDIDLSCFYNDRRMTDRGPQAGPLPTADEIRAALPLSRYEWEYEPDIPQRKLYVNVGEVDGAIEFVMSADTRYFSEQDMIDVLRDMEAVAVETALDPSAPTGVTESVATPV